nr:MAG TPA: hypothetical protein [Microviridae sp.]
MVINNKLGARIIPLAPFVLYLFYSNTHFFRHYQIFGLNIC